MFHPYQRESKWSGMNVKLRFSELFRMTGFSECMATVSVSLLVPDLTIVYLANRFLACFVAILMGCVLTMPAAQATEDYESWMSDIDNV